MVEQIPLNLDPNDHNRRYLQTKRDRMKHQIELDDDTPSPSGPAASRRRFPLQTSP